MNSRIGQAYSDTYHSVAQTFWPVNHSFDLPPGGQARHRALTAATSAIKAMPNTYGRQGAPAVGVGKARGERVA